MAASFEQMIDLKRHPSSRRLTMKIRKMLTMHRRNTWKGVAAGIIGGLAGAWSMNQFQRVWNAAAARADHHQGNNVDQQESQGESEDATMKAAGKIAQSTFHKRLSKQQKQQLGPVVHYAFGALSGGLYGGVVENVAIVKRGAGVPFGSALFLAADEVGVPAFGLSPSPTELPLSSPFCGWASHAFWGAVRGVVRRYTRHALRFV